MTIPPLQQPYYCAHHTLLAHAKTYQLFKSLNVTGTLSLKNNGGYKVPLTNSSEDAIAVQRAWDFNEGWYSNPIYVNGDYPPHLKAYVETIPLSFTEFEKKLIYGSADLYAHDAYTSSYYMAPEGGVDACTSNTSHSLYPLCFNTTNVGADGWLIGMAADPLASWLHKATDWVPTFLKYIQDTWPSKGGIVVSEFGYVFLSIPILLSIFISCLPPLIFQPPIHRPPPSVPPLLPFHSTAYYPYSLTPYPLLPYSPPSIISDNPD